MTVHDGFKYKQAKNKVKELKSLLLQLDKAADILYNNLSYSGVWNLIQHLEETRIQYYIEYHEYNVIVKNKGRLNE